MSSPHLSVLIVAGAPKKPGPFEAMRLTVKVEPLEPFLAILTDAAAESLEPVPPTPIGRKTRFRHADGLVLEYVDLNDSPAS